MLQPISTRPYHFPVLGREVVELLQPQPNKIFVDATLGNGGHTIALLEHGSTVFGIDQDPDNLALAHQRIKSLKLDKNFIPVHANFKNLSHIWQESIKAPLDGILVDLGLSSNQQTSVNRGFSFNDPDSLDMRLDPDTQTLTAEYVINVYPYEELVKIFSYYAQEKFAKPLTQKIIRARQRSPLKTGMDLANVIRQFYIDKNIKTAIDPATKIFMALRIFINDEYENLKAALDATLTIVKPQGLVAIISFHSGEDRIVKQFIKKHQLLGKIIELKHIQPSQEEIAQNHLSRSAILRSYRIV